MGTRDPTCRIESGRLELATRTPDGPAAARISLQNGQFQVELWGEGAAWLEGRCAALLGLVDNPAAFRPPEGPLRRLWRRAPGLHLPRAPSLFTRSVQAVLQQLVTSAEAYRSWRLLTRALGEPAPGLPHLALPPHSEAMVSAPEHVYRGCGVPARRINTLRRLARLVDRIESIADSAALGLLLGSVPGIGPWTVGYVSGVGLGDPDAVLTGDYNLPSTVAWALAGESRADDRRMLELLEPYRGHRYRVVRIIHTTGGRAPRRGPRRPIRYLR